MSQRKDYKARYGAEPAWDLQRLKQEQIAENRDDRIHGELITMEDLEE